MRDIDNRTITVYQRDGQSRGAGISSMGSTIWLAMCLLSMLPLRTASAAPAPKATTLLATIQIRESGRRNVLEGIPVYIMERKSQHYTNSKGEFQVKLVPLKTYTFVIKTVGYLQAKLKQKLPADGKLFLYIKPDPFSPLQSTSRARRVKTTPEQVKFSRKQMRELPGVLGGDPIRAFQNMAGVARAARSGGDIVVRGAAFADTGFYMDGHRIPILYHFGAGLSVINRRFLKSIEFYPGGSPISFGRLTAGLISAQSRDAKGDGVHGDFYVSLAAVGGYIEVPIGKHWSIAAAASRSYIDAFFSLITQDPLVGAFWDYQFKVLYRTQKHRLSFFVFGSDDSFDFAGPEKSGAVPLVGGEKRNRALRFAKLITQYQYRGKSFRLNTSLGVGFVQDFDEIPSQLTDKWDAPVELRIDMSWKLHEKHSLDAGLDGLWRYRTYRLRQSFAEPGAFPTPVAQPIQDQLQGNNNILAPALYLNWRWQPHKKIRIQTGVRGDLYMFQNQLRINGSPRLSATFDPHKKVRILLNTGYYNRNPEVDVWTATIGNPNLRLPKAFQSSAGLEVRPIRPIQIRATFFYNQMFDLIVPSNRTIERNGALVQENFSNDGFGRSYGLEVLFRMRFGRRVFGWLTYTLSRAERGVAPSNEYKLFEFDQTHIFNAMVVWNIGWGVTVSGRFRMASGNPVSPILRTTYDADSDDYRPVFGTFGSERLPMFHQLDLRIDYKYVFNKWILGLYLDVINVYNARVGEEYRYNYNFTEVEAVRGISLFTILGVRGEF